MTMQAVQEFYMASKGNGQLIGKMAEGAKGLEDFIRNAVAEGKHQGYEFSYGEGEQFVNNMKAAMTKKTAGGELSDIELEMVAGGKASGAETVKPAMEVITAAGKFYYNYTLNKYVIDDLTPVVKGLIDPNTYKKAWDDTGKALASIFSGW